MIGDRIEVSVVDIKGDQVKLGINAPRTVKVFRQEVYRAIQLENRAAASAAARTGTDLPQIESMLQPKEDDAESDLNNGVKNDGSS